MSYQEDELDTIRSFSKLDTNYESKSELIGLSFPISEQTKNNISYEIETIHKVIGCNSYIESLSMFMDLYNYEYSDINKLMSTTILNKISAESLKNGWLKASINELKCHDVQSWAL